MRKYNNNIDSIGTEYSPVSDMINYDDYTNQGNPMNAMRGGGDNDNIMTRMWNYVSNIGDQISETINGKDEIIDKVLSDKDITAMIMTAIEEGKNETANFLLGYSFVPNMDYLNKKKQNLIHVLINAADKVPNAKKTLEKLIKLPNVKESLSMPDINNERPLYSALKHGLKDIASKLGELGASRLAPHDDEEIQTDYSIRSEESDRDRASDQSKRININRVSSQNTNSSNNIFVPQRNNMNKPKSMDGYETISGRDVSTISPNILHQMFNRNKADSSISVRFPISSEMREEPIKQSGQGINTDELINSLINDIMGDNSQSGGGKKKKSTKTNNKPNKKKTVTKQNKRHLNTVKDHRKMVGGSEISDSEMNELFSRPNVSSNNKNELRDIARAAANQKTKLHEEALAKISALLKDKDIMTSRAIKAILYKEISDKHKEMTGLDKAAELLRMATQTKIDEALKRKDEIKAIVDYLKHKESERKNTENDNKEKLSRTMKRSDIQYESSESITPSESESLESDSESGETEESEESDNSTDASISTDNSTNTESDSNKTSEESDDGEDEEDEEDETDVTSVDTSEIEDSD